MTFLKLFFVSFELILSSATFTLEHVSLNESCLISETPAIELPQAPPIQGFIIMDDDVMIVTIENGNDSIRSISLVSSDGFSHYTFTGCGLAQCTEDLSSLNSGIYFATVTSDLGYFNQTISLK